MNNIFEIQFDNNINYLNIIKLIKSLGDFSIFNNCFYLTTEYNENKIRNIFKDNLKIKSITKNNYNNIENDFCKKWCYKILLDNEKTDFEKNNQNYLQKINKDLDFLMELKEEGKLEEYMAKFIKKGGGKAARENNK